MITNYYSIVYHFFSWTFMYVIFVKFSLYIIQFIYTIATHINAQYNKLKKINTIKNAIAK